MLRMKDLPPMEREGNGSLYRMDAKQRREAVRLIRAHCGFYDNSNCLYLCRHYDRNTLPLPRRLYGNTNRRVVLLPCYSFSAV